jgi:hypothetical protein
MRRPQLCFALLLPLLTGCIAELGAAALLSGNGGKPHPLPPPPAGALTPGVEVSEVSLAVPGALLRGQLHRRAGATRALLWFYGNGGSVAQTGLQASNLAEALQADLLAIDYRGYGASTGTADLAGLDADGLAAFDWLELLLPGKPIVVGGHSLGAGVSVHVATARPVAGLFLFAPPPSLAAVLPALQASLPWPVRWLVWVQFDEELAGFHQVPEEEAPLVSAPALVVVGTRDALVLPAASRRLFDALGSADKELCTVEAAHDQTQPAEVLALACAVRFAERRALLGALPR